MNPFQPLGVAAWAWRGVASQLLKPVIWVPFILVAVVQVIVLWLLVSFHHEAVLPAGGPLVKLLAGDQNRSHCLARRWSCPA